MSDFWPYGMTLQVILPWHHFQNAPLWWLLRELEQLRIACKVLARYGFDNAHQFVSFAPWPVNFAFSVSGPLRCGHGSINDNKYRAMFGKDYHGDGANVYEVHFWAASGIPMIFQELFICDHMKVIPKLTMERIGAALENYCSGKMACSDCGSLLPLSDLPGHYFAGKYCSPCWLGERGRHKGAGGWKVIEARETYD